MSFLEFFLTDRGSEFPPSPWNLAGAITLRRIIGGGLDDGAESGGNEGFS
jgi:hypothetical protein